MIKKIIIDVDDTLFDFRKCERTALCLALADIGVNPSDETVKLYSRINDGQWKALERGEIEREALLLRRFDLLFEAISVRADSALMQSKYEKRLGEQVEYIDGAIELLEELSRDCELYVASNGTAVVQDPRIEKSGIAKYFKAIFISERVGYNKPDRRFFEACLEEMGNPPLDEVIVLGDSLTSDIKGAKSIGVKSCWFNPSGAENKSDVKADFEIRHLLDFPKVLGKINKM